MLIYLSLNSFILWAGATGVRHSDAARTQLSYVCSCFIVVFCCFLLFDVGVGGINFSFFL